MRSVETGVRPIFAVVKDWVKKLSLTYHYAMPTGKELDKYHDAFCNAIRDVHSQRKMAHTRQLRYLIRHTAYRIPDQAYEMEDKDLTIKSGYTAHSE